MHKITQFILSLFTLLGLLLIESNTVKADEPNYDITNVQVKAKVQKNGNLAIERRISYYFHNSAHGIFYKQNLNDNQKVVNPEVGIIDKGKFKKISKSNSENNNTYQLENYGNTKFTVFHKSKADSKFTVVYRYQIENAIKNWNDTGELNFKIIGDGWDTKLNHVKAEVIFPSAVKGLKAWGHGDLNGHIDVLPSKGKIILTQNNVPGNMGIEVHALFPTNVTPLNKNISAKKHLQEVLDEEKEFAEEANRERRKVIVKASLYLLGSIVSSILGIIFLIKTKKEGVFPQKISKLPRSYEIPNVDPAMAQFLDKGIDKAYVPNKKGLAGYLLYLAGKHKIKIESFEKGKIRKKTYYSFTILDTKILPKQPLLFYLFERIGDGKSFSTYDIKNAPGNNSLGDRFDHWQASYEEKAKRAGFFNEDGFGSKLLSVFIASILISLSAFCIIASVFNTKLPLWSILTAIAFILAHLILTIISYKMRVSIYTEKGAQETNQIRGFKKMLLEIGNFKMKDVGELILWEDIMPYAVAFGITKKVLKQLKLEFNESELADAGFYTYMSISDNDTFDNFTHGLEDSFKAGAGMGLSTFNKDNNDSSDSGDSGGFSGGDSGGFGDGSGGGAF